MVTATTMVAIIYPCGTNNIPFFSLSHTHTLTLLQYSAGQQYHDAGWLMAVGSSEVRWEVYDLVSYYVSKECVVLEKARDEEWQHAEVRTKYL